MKKPYPGLSTQRIVIECQSLMANSNVDLKAKTKVQDWEKENVNKEFGLSDEISGNMVISDI